jgi:hypothetical protein
MWNQNKERNIRAYKLELTIINERFKSKITKIEKKYTK